MRLIIMSKKKNSKRNKRLKKKRKHQLSSLQNKSEVNKVNILIGEAKSSIHIFENNGGELITSDYWGTEDARKGFFLLSINAGVFRLLVPENSERLISEFKTGEYCIISKGPSKMSIHPFLFELLFEDHTSAPYGLTLSPGQVDRIPPISDAGSKFKMFIYTKGCKKVLEMDAYYRVVDRIPYLKPLGKQFKNVS